MTTNLGWATLADIPDTYAALVAAFPPRALHDDNDHANALEIIDAMMGHELNADQADYLDTISTLAAAYEDTHHPVDLSGLTAAALLRELLDQNDMTGADLGRLLGNVSLGSPLLSGKRKPTPDHALKLADRFGVDPALFLFPDRAKNPA